MFKKSSLKTKESAVFETEKKSKFNFLGDYRFRYQSEAQEPAQQRPIGRFQLRLGVEYEIEPAITLVTRFMTGTAAESGNQTIGDSKSSPSSRRNFGIDLAHVKFHNDEKFVLNLGRSPIPFFFAGGNQLLLDKDISLEGLTSVSSLSKGSSQINLNLCASILRENYDSTNGIDELDNSFYGGQLVFISDLGQLFRNDYFKENAYKIKLAYGQYSWIGLKDTNPSKLLGTTNAQSRGNLLENNGSGVETYINNFDIKQSSIEFNFILLKMNFKLFYESLRNTSATSLNLADSKGIGVGFKNLSFQYALQKIERESVVGIFTDSDFAGGNTGSRGSVLTIAYQATKKMSFAFSQYNNEVNFDFPSPNGFKRQQLDCSVKF